MVRQGEIVGVRKLYVSAMLLDSTVRVMMCCGESNWIEVISMIFIRCLVFFLFPLP